MLGICLLARWRNATVGRMFAGYVWHQWRSNAALLLAFFILLIWCVLTPDLRRPIIVPTLTNTESIYQEPPIIDWAATHDYVAMAPFNFSLPISNTDICSDDDDGEVKLLVFAYSAPADALPRKVIRETWGSRKLLSQTNTKLVFPLGRSHKQAINYQIERESALYGDIIQGDFIDSYRNLSYKGILILSWAQQYCRQAKFLLKVDLDVFINMPMVVPFLEENYGNEQRFFGCKVHWRSAVLRPGEWCGKWCVSEEEYRGRYYPPYCWGSVYVISGDLISRLANSSAHVPIWWIADVYLTGMLPLALGRVKHIVFRDYLEEDRNYFLYRLEKHPHSVLFGFIHDIHDVRLAWDIARVHINISQPL